MKSTKNKLIGKLKIIKSSAIIISFTIVFVSLSAVNEETNKNISAGKPCLTFAQTNYQLHLPDPRHGPVPVEWKRTSGGGLNFRINIPEGVTAAVSIPRPSDKPIMTIDGRIERRARQTNRFLTVELGPGEHSGTITP
jgi:hypothetical protein